MFGRVLTFLTAVTTAVCGMTADVYADEAQQDSAQSVDAQSVYVCEISSSQTLYEQNSEQTLPMGHMAKLMTVLICAEELEKGALSLDETVTVSVNANSKQGTQIWLEVGERVSVEDLLKAIIVGNANDACTALAERLSGDEEAYVQRLNKRAKRLGMSNTVFADCTGTDLQTVSTAKDIAILSCEIAKYENLKVYFTTWIDNVRGGLTELVSTNRLIRTYKGILGMKACASSESGECISACVKRGNLGICVVLLGCSDSEGKIDAAESLLDESFESYSYFLPEIDKSYLEPIKVTGGRKLSVKVEAENLSGAVIDAGGEEAIELEADIKDSVEAPVSKGDVLGKITCKNSDETLITVNIVAAENVQTMNFGYALKSCLLNLLNCNH